MKLKGWLISIIVGLASALAFWAWRLFSNKAEFQSKVRSKALESTAWQAPLKQVEDLAKTFQEESAKATVALTKAKHAELRDKVKSTLQPRRPSP